ncbi:MAG: hypothetical protein ABW049_03865 [Spongiibacteraceae bacterium]
MLMLHELLKIKSAANDASEDRMIAAKLEPARELLSQAGHGLLRFGRRAALLSVMIVPPNNTAPQAASGLWLSRRADRIGSQCFLAENQCPMFYWLSKNSL